MKFAEVLKEIRKEKGFTQVELAKLAGITPSCVSMIEIGSREPNARTIIALATALNVSADFLLGLEDEFGNVVVKESQILSKNEEKLVNSFRNLSESEQEKLLSDAEFYSKRNK